MMKGFFYGIYALFFNISAALFPLKKNRVCFLSMHNEGFCDSLGSVCDCLREKRSDMQTVYITREDLSLKNPLRLLSFFLIKSRLLATSEYIFLNDNFLPMGKLNFKKDAVITQLWHAEGVFKKFGLDITQPDEVRKAEAAANGKLTYVVCSSEGVRDIYAGAFGVKKQQVLPLGAPRCDFLIKQGNAEKAREELLQLYPQCRGKRVVLYAPTFRDTKEGNLEIMRHFDTKKFTALSGDEYVLMVKLHPQVHEGVKIENAIDVTDFDDVRKLALFCDVLITDYSSICMDFAFLDKKTVFFAYDLEEYTAKRDFYFPYEGYVPGKTVFTLEDCAEAVKEETDREKNEKFKGFNFSFFDAKSSERVIEAVMK
ncbi:MAG: hypothetical protein E7538_08515 [Ruminococcaceae bacterium]|nr:hypothetical protein [Oscillospiraceae bacterium]